MISLIDKALAKQEEQHLNCYPGSVPVNMQTGETEDDCVFWKAIESTVTDQDISELEDLLGVKLCPQYVRFLKHKHFIELQIGEVSFFPHPSIGWKASISDAVFESWPRKFLIDKGYLPFADYSDWGLWCFGVNEPDNEGEYPVYQWDHEQADYCKRVAKDLSTAIALEIEKMEKPTPMPQCRFGRIVVDDTGISRHKWLFFGKSFRISWADLEAFAVSETVLASRATGEEQVLNQTLELHSAATMEVVQMPEAAGRFKQLVALLRNRCPEKEKESLLAMYKSLPQGGPDAVNALLAQFDGVIHAELERVRGEFPQPTEEGYAAMFKLISQRVAAAKNLSARHANQIVSWYFEKHAPDILQAVRKPTAGTPA